MAAEFTIPEPDFEVKGGVVKHWPKGKPKSSEKEPAKVEPKPDALKP